MSNPVAQAPTRVQKKQGILSYPVGPVIPLTEEERKRRIKRPRQEIISSLVGPIEAGGDYLVYLEHSEISADAAFTIMRTLDKYGRSFEPPVTFFIVPKGTKMFDLSKYRADRAPKLLKDSAKIPSALTLDETYVR